MFETQTLVQTLALLVRRADLSISIHLAILMSSHPWGLKLKSKNQLFQLKTKWPQLTLHNIISLIHGTLVLF